MSRSPYDTPRSELTIHSTDQAGSIRVLQIITFALVQGVVFFAAVVFFIQGAPREFDVAVDPAAAEQPAESNDFMLWLFCAIAAAQVTAHFIVPPLLVNKQLGELRGDSFNAMTESDKAGRLVELYRAPHIVACALAESAAFLCLVGYMIVPSVIFLAVALIAVVLILVRFPTTSKVNFWIEDQIRSLSMGA